MSGWGKPCKEENLQKNNFGTPPRKGVSFSKNLLGRNDNNSSKHAFASLAGYPSSFSDGFGDIVRSAVGQTLHTLLYKLLQSEVVEL